MAAAAYLGFSPASALAPASDSLTAALRTAIDRGELLYIYDQVAWRGTDDIREKYPNLLKQAGGYVVTGDHIQTEVVFYDKRKISAIYRATFSNGKLSGSGPPTAGRTGLTALELRMMVAKEKAYDVFLAAEVGLCSRDMPNIAALPPERVGGPITVYLMTPQTDMKKYPLGGHFSVEVRSDGSTGKIRRFTNACIDMPMDALPAGGQPRAFVVTHLLDPTPTEIHVFTSIVSKVPIVVVTRPDARMWSVDGNRIVMAGSAIKK